MIKAARVLAVVIALALIGTAALAVVAKDVRPGDPTEVVGGKNVHYNWAGDWSGGLLPLDLNWYRAYGYENRWTMGGYKDEDPTVDEVITNFTEDLWVDWHIIVENGTISEAIIYKSAANYVLWDTVIIHGATADSIIAVAPDPLDPAMGIGMFEDLTVHFVFAPKVPGNVFIEEWPTIDGTIPEPSSIAALAMGLATLGFALRRRVS